MENRWYLLWFVTAAMWTVTFCANAFSGYSLDWVMTLQFLIIFVSIEAGIVNAKRYRKKLKEMESDCRLSEKEEK